MSTGIGLTQARKVPSSFCGIVKESRRHVLYYLVAPVEVGC
jgi:hypothetical protein